MRRFASFVNCFLQNWYIDTFKHKTDKYSVHFQEMQGFKGKRKWGLILTLHKKPFRYRLPVSPPRKPTKTSSSTPNLKSPSTRTPSLLNNSLSISKYLYPFKRVFGHCRMVWQRWITSNEIFAINSPIFLVREKVIWWSLHSVYVWPKTWKWHFNRIFNAE